MRCSAQPARSPRASVALKVFHRPPPLGEPNEESLRPTLLPADSCRTAGIEEMGLHRSRQSVVSSNKRPRVGTALPLTAACSGSRFWRALGPPGDQSGDRLGSVGMRGLTPRGKDATCAADSLTTCYEDNGLLMLLGSRHTTRPAHAGVGGHRTTVSPLFFIAYPQTRVPAPSVLGPYADATGQSLNP